jgi:hypothetical protein
VICKLEDSALRHLHVGRPISSLGWYSRLLAFFLNVLNREEIAMSLSDLASLGSFVSGAAIVASLIFLGLQMRQNTRAVVASASQAHVAEMQAILHPIVLEKDVARFWYFGMADLSALDDVDRARFVLICAGLFRFFDAARLQWESRLLSADHWHATEIMVRDIIGNPGVRMAWEMRRHWHSAEFQNWVDSLARLTPQRGLFELPTTSRNGN